MGRLPDRLDPTTRCGAPTSAGTTCWGWVVRGFDRCLHHVSDDQLAEAELVAGFQRCHHAGCAAYALACTEPPRCRSHGANPGSAMWWRAQMRAAATEIAEEALGIRTWRKRRKVPLKATWRNVA